jgi:hypothetical protein
MIADPRTAISYAGSSIAVANSQKLWWLLSSAHSEMSWGTAVRVDRLLNFSVSASVALETLTLFHTTEMILTI